MYFYSKINYNTFFSEIIYNVLRDKNHVQCIHFVKSMYLYDKIICNAFL